MMGQASMFETRAQSLGIKPKPLVNKALRTVAAARKKLEVLAEPFDGIDGQVQTDLATLLDAIDDFTKGLHGTLEWLNEPLEDM